MAFRCFILAVAHFVPAGAIAIAPSSSRLKPLGGGGFVSIPMRLYKQDCGGKTKGAALAQVPGAGMSPDDVTPFQEVLKDGFYEVTCVKDFMYEHGDKFGDGKFAYELGDVSNVSIVHYELHVNTEDRESMTHDVCFKFCRTIPDMSFFGLTHGRDCYCTPYYTPEASDSSSCDAVCDGDNTMMCGGMSKSNVFQMHECGDTATDIADATAKMSTVSDGLTEVSGEVETVAEVMQMFADVLQPVFGTVGDSVATGLLQSAKVTAGRLLAAATAGSELVDNMDELEKSAQSAGDSGFEAVTAAESLVVRMGAITTKGEGAAEELGESLALVKPPASAGNASSSLYYPVMYFVDKDHANLPSTCGGASAREAIVSDFEGCAAACTAAVGPPSCVGFSYFSQGSGGLCFLFNTLTSATFYTGCNNSDAFLQRSTKDASGTKCMAKLADYEGTSIAPDASGKCAKCLKSAVKADRCFE